MSFVSLELLKKVCKNEQMYMDIHLPEINPVKLRTEYFLFQ